MGTFVNALRLQFFIPFVVVCLVGFFAGRAGSGSDTEPPPARLAPGSGRVPQHGGPDECAWLPSSGMSTARQDHTATRLGPATSGKVLVAGGQNGAAIAGAELYAAWNNTWSPAGSMATARA